MQRLGRHWQWCSFHHKLILNLSHAFTQLHSFTKFATISTDTVSLVRFSMYRNYILYVCICASVFLTGDTIAVPVGPKDSRRLVFEWCGVRLAYVHPVLLCLQILVVALVFIVVLSLAVVWGGVAGQGWGRRHRGRSRVAEARGLRMRTKAIAF